MSLEISEDLVSLAYQSLGYFVIEGRMVGRKEIDLLALRVGEEGRVAERLHIEVQISVTPVGLLRGKPGLPTGRDLHEATRDFVIKKFLDPRIQEAVTRAFGGKPYDRVLVHGRVSNPEQLKVLASRHNIRCEAVRDLVNRATASDAPNRLKRAFGIAELIVNGRKQ